MRLFGLGKSSKRVRGSIGYFGLEDWWLTTFTDNERQYIQTVFQPLGSSGESLTTDTISYTSETVVGLLSALAGWFRKPDDRTIAHRILDKAVELSRDAPVLDVHFLYQQIIETYYKDRDKPGCMDKAVEACRQQIALAPSAAKAFKAEYGNLPLPSHKGYEQLAIVMEKQGHFREALVLSQQAESQGWAGTWARRVERCQKKLDKA